MPHIPRIPIDSGNNTLRKFIYKLTDSELSHMSLHHCLEHYKKKQSRLFDTAALPNEIKVSGSSKAHDLCTKAVHRLKEHSADGVIVSASGSHVTKAVTVVELLKRRVPALSSFKKSLEVKDGKNLHQDTQLKYIKVEDVWEPDMEDLDSLKVVRRIPAISMHLSSSSTTQTQTLADEHHQVAMASSEHSEKSLSSTRSGSHKAGIAAAAERRDKGKGQGLRSQGGGGVKKPGKKIQAAAGSGGHGRVKGRSKSAQANETAEDNMNQT